jgi:hypothetical protein
MLRDGEAAAACKVLKGDVPAIQPSVRGAGFRGAGLKVGGSVGGEMRGDVSEDAVQLRYSVGGQGLSSSVHLEGKEPCRDTS